jgi:hypothetical protein
MLSVGVPQGCLLPQGNAIERFIDLLQMEIERHRYNIKQVYFEEVVKS